MSHTSCHTQPMRLGQWVSLGSARSTVSVCAEVAEVTWRPCSRVLLLQHSWRGSGPFQRLLLRNVFPLCQRRLSVAQQGTSGNRTTEATSDLFPPGSAHCLISVSQGITTRGCVASPSLPAGLSGLPEPGPPRDHSCSRSGPRTGPSSRSRCQSTVRGRASVLFLSSLLLFLVISPNGFVFNFHCPVCFCWKFTSVLCHGASFVHCGQR